jgi:hypothetical protein
MDWGKTRPYALLTLAVIAAVTMFPSIGGGGSGGSPPLTVDRAGYDVTDCGTFPSGSTGSPSRVLALRAVGCGRALAIARAYDHTGKRLGDWRCARDAGERGFSCGSGRHRGDLRNAPHALLVKPTAK